MYFSHSCYVGLLSNNPKNRQEQRPICFLSVTCNYERKEQRPVTQHVECLFHWSLKCELMGGANLQTYTKELSRKYPKGER